jgi:hypothetical protein
MIPDIETVDADGWVNLIRGHPSKYPILRPYKAV